MSIIASWLFWITFVWWEDLEMFYPNVIPLLPQRYLTYLHDVFNLTTVQNLNIHVIIMFTYLGQDV